LADDIVFVQVDPQTRKPIPHGKTFKQLSNKADLDNLNY
jgi:hypothetical protein